jgi:predicted transcriptional regulator
MNIYQTQAVRQKHKISWAEEYLLGMIDANGSLLTKKILEKASSVMSLATTHKYLMLLLEKGYAKHKLNKEDKRIAIVILTNKGIDFMKEVSHVIE